MAAHRAHQSNTNEDGLRNQSLVFPKESASTFERRLRLAVDREALIFRKVQKSSLSIGQTPNISSGIHLRTLDRPGTGRG